MTQQDESLQGAFQKFEALGADYVRTKLDIGAYQGAELDLAEEWLATQSGGAPVPAAEQGESGGKLKWFLMLLLVVSVGLFAAVETGYLKVPQNLLAALPF